MVTLVKWKAMMDTGQDPREGTFPSLGLIVDSWLLAVTNSITFHVFLSTASREFVVVRGGTIMHSYSYKISLVRYLKIFSKKELKSSL